VFPPKMKIGFKLGIAFWCDYLVHNKPAFLNE